MVHICICPCPSVPSHLACTCDGSGDQFRSICNFNFALDPRAHEWTYLFLDPRAHEWTYFFLLNFNIFIGLFLLKFVVEMAVSFEPPVMVVSTKAAPIVVDLDPEDPGHVVETIALEHLAVLALAGRLPPKDKELFHNTYREYVKEDINGSSQAQLRMLRKFYEARMKESQPAQVDQEAIAVLKEDWRAASRHRPGVQCDTCTLYLANLEGQDACPMCNRLLLSWPAFLEIAQEKTTVGSEDTVDGDYVKLGCLDHPDKFGRFNREAKVKLVAAMLAWRSPRVQGSDAPSMRFYFQQRNEVSNPGKEKKSDGQWHDYSLGLPTCPGDTVGSPGCSHAISRRISSPCQGC